MTVLGTVVTIRVQLFVVEAGLDFEGVVLLGRASSRDFDLAFEAALAWSCFSVAAETEIARGADDGLNEGVEGRSV